MEDAMTCGEEPKTSTGSIRGGIEDGERAEEDRREQASISPFENT